MKGGGSYGQKIAGPPPPWATECRAVGCEIRIVWLETDGGGKMPVEKFPDGSWPTPSQRFDPEVHLDHWTHCPGAREMRGGKKR